MAEYGDVKERILSAVPLVSLVGEHVALSRRASQFVGCCPFHAEKTGSFYVYDDHFHCFGCGAHGDAITFITRVMGLKFREALRWLAQKYGIDFPEDPAEQKLWKKRSAQQRLMQQAQEFFNEQLHSPQGAAAREYLLGRGFSESLWAEYGFGYAPASPQGLIRSLQEQGFALEDLEQCSLASTYNNRSYDFFQDRVMVPIRDHQGRLVAFGGRTMGSDPQKYKNSRYDKSSVLFGLDRARQPMQASGHAIVVEGYLDAIQLWANGFAEAVASQGTALTREHLSRLSQNVKNVYLLFDGDQAGRNAVQRAFELSFEFPNLFFKVVSLPDGQDPDSYVRAQGKEALQALIHGAQDIFALQVQTRLRNASESGKPELVRSEFIPWLTKISDPIRKSFIIQKIAQETGIDAHLLQKQTQSHQEKPGLDRLVKKEHPSPASTLESSAVLEASAEGPLPSALARELLGHLFYATPGGFPVQQAEEFLLNELGLSGAWALLVEEMAACLRSQKKPCEENTGTWAAAYARPVEAFLGELNARPGAFLNQSGEKVWERIQWEHKRRNLRRTLYALKAQTMAFRLDGQGAQDQNVMREVTATLMTLSRELDAVEKALR